MLDDRRSTSASRRAARLPQTRPPSRAAPAGQGPASRARTAKRSDEEARGARAEHQGPDRAAGQEAPVVGPRRLRHRGAGVQRRPAEVEAATVRIAERTSYREEVEAELQRILSEAGLDTELQGILTDARAEAERQGVSMDSDLIMRALADEANGSAKLSDSAKGELKQRFQRIADEERGDPLRSPSRARRVSIAPRGEVARGRQRGEEDPVAVVAGY